MNTFEAQASQNAKTIRLTKPFDQYAPKNSYDFKVTPSQRQRMQCDIEGDSSIRPSNKKFVAIGALALSFIAAGTSQSIRTGIADVINRMPSAGQVITEKQFENMDKQTVNVRQGEGADAAIIQVQPEILNGSHAAERVADEHYVGRQLQGGTQANVPLVPLG